MKTVQQHLPKLDMSTSKTGCCPTFRPDLWDDIVFEFDNKTFIKDRTTSFMHIPLNMGKVMTRMNKQVTAAKAETEEFAILCEEVSPWHAAQYFATSKEVPGADNVALTGKFYAKVFEGPFKNAELWHKDLVKSVAENGYTLKRTFFLLHNLPQMRQGIRQKLCSRLRRDYMKGTY